MKLTVRTIFNWVPIFERKIAARDFNKVQSLLQLILRSNLAKAERWRPIWPSNYSILLSFCLALLCVRLMFKLSLVHIHYLWHVHNSSRPKQVHQFKGIKDLDAVYLICSRLDSAWGVLWEHVRHNCRSLSCKKKHTQLCCLYILVQHGVDEW